MELLTEKFASKKLAAFAKQHGGIQRWINGGRREGVKAWYGNSAIDLSTVTDDMLQGEPFDFDGNITSDQLNNAILFNDGFAVALKPYRLHKQDGTQEPQPKKRRTSKYGTGIGDTGDHDKRPSPFINGGGKNQGQEYNPYGISVDTGYANSLRGAMANNKLDAKFYKDAGVQSRAREAEKSLAQNRKDARDLLKTHDRSQIKPMPLDESELKKLVTASVKKLMEAIKNGETNIDEISTGLLGRAQDAAFNDMQRNWNDNQIRTKRDRQWKNFSSERIRRDTEDKNNVCPSVPEEELKNLPKGSYVVMNGTGRNAITANFMSSYSGHAGTKEQCEEYVNRFYDSSANWEFQPSIIPVEEYLMNHR